MKLNPESTASATTTAAEATAHPELFRCYWGNFTLARNPEITPAIIANRNRFAEKWQIVARSRAMIPRPTVSGKVDYDHPELYRNRAGLYVLVVSHYGTTPPPSILGMQKIPPLYCEGATSFAVSGTLTELRARLDAAEERGPKFGAARHLFTEPPAPRRSARKGRGRVSA